MRIIPVLDWKGGVVVRGVAGRRAEYRPIVSQLTNSFQPADVARAIRDHLGLDEFYIADLDAIAGSEPAWQDYRALQAMGFRLWVDAGVRERCGAVRLAEAGVDRIVLGLETISGPTEVQALLDALGAERVIFSLDLREGAPFGDVSKWNAPDAAGIAGQAVELGVRSLIVLDLTRVGVGQGIGTEELCARLAKAHPEVEVIVGGGVRGIEDLRTLARHGVRAALVASALHQRIITKSELHLLSAP